MVHSSKNHKTVISISIMFFWLPLLCHSLDLKSEELNGMKKWPEDGNSCLMNIQNTQLEGRPEWQSVMLFVVSCRGERRGSGPIYKNLLKSAVIHTFL